MTLPIFEPMDIYVPNWIRRVLLVASVLSFVPQFRYTISRKSTSGISLCYTLFNLVIATEVFALALYYVDYDGGKVNYRRPPPSIGDWINVAQTAIVALCWLSLLALIMVLPSHRATSSKLFALFVYALFFIICVPPVIYTHMYPEFRTKPITTFMDIWFGFHQYLVFIPTTMLNISSLFFQLEEAHQRPRGLSSGGLAVQAFVFALVAVSWLFRVGFDEDTDTPETATVYSALVGYIFINTAIFVFYQAVLWLTTCAAGRKMVNKGKEVYRDSERRPLLA